MLIFTRSAGARVYVGAACVVQFVGLGPDRSAVLLVWDGGRETCRVLRLGERLALGDGGAVVQYLRPTTYASEATVRLGFDAPPEVRIMRAELLSPDERLLIKKAAGVPDGPARKAV